eukprot:8328357-Heterocapsa_arctica.AAC.1
MAAWKRLVGEYEPDLAGRHCAVLAGLLTRDWSGKAAFIDQLLEWERRLAEYELATKVLVPDPLKCAVVLRWAPPRVREFLRISPVDLTGNYPLLKNALKDFQQRGCEFDIMGQ